METEQTFKEIPVDKVVANSYQPREKFDAEQIKELAQSIVAGGLINPITVRIWKDGKYMIVAGERRWRAHKFAGLKTIKAIVKDYKDDGQWMAESFIENVHREDLSREEKYNFMKKIMELENISTLPKLAERVKMSYTTVRSLFDESEIRKELSADVNEKASGAVIAETAGLEKEERKKVIEYATKKDLGHRAMRELKKKINKLSKSDVKEALFNDEISVEQAERISKLNSKEERQKAIQEHSAIKHIDNNVESNIENRKKLRDDKEFKKKLVLAGNWISNFRGSVTDSTNILEKAIKILMISTKFIPIMDERQKQTLDQQLDRFIEVLGRANQLTEQIQEKIQ